LETIKNKHLARRHDLKRQTTTTAVSVNNIEQKDFLNSLFSSSSPNSIGLTSMDNNNGTPTSIPSPLFSSSNDQPTSFYQHQQNSSQQFDPGQASSYSHVKAPSFDEFLTSPSSSYIPVNNNPSLSVHSYMNVSFQGTTNDSTTPSSFNHHHHHHHHHHNNTYPF
jgi:hypothetical protein